jgi:hypothetical protein
MYCVCYRSGKIIEKKENSYVGRMLEGLNTVLCTVFITDRIEMVKGRRCVQARRGLGLASQDVDEGTREVSEKLMFTGKLKECQKGLSSSVLNALKLCTRYTEVFGGFSGRLVIDIGKLQEHIGEVCREFDPQTHMADAVAAVFVVPDEVWTKDADRTRAGLSVVECAREMR